MKRQDAYINDSHKEALLCFLSKRMHLSRKALTHTGAHHITQDAHAWVCHGIVNACSRLAAAHYTTLSESGQVLGNIGLTCPRQCYQMIMSRGHANWQLVPGLLL